MKKTLDLLIPTLWKIKDSTKYEYKPCSLKCSNNKTTEQSQQNTLVSNPPCLATPINTVNNKMFMQQLTLNNKQSILQHDATQLSSLVPNDNHTHSTHNYSNAVAPAKRLDTPLTAQWQTLEQNIIACDKCSLCYERTNVVIGKGSHTGQWMFIGEAPGEQEDKEGRPFVGKSGQLLDKMIQAMQIDWQNNVYITNIIKCRPPHNRNPQAEEINQCFGYLQQQITLVNPQIIVTLGRFSTQTLLNTQLAIGKLRGKVHYYKNIPLIATFHPSYLLRTPEAKKDAWQDLQLALHILKTI